MQHPSAAGSAPRRPARQIEIAHAVVARYGDPDGIINAPAAEILNLPGVGPMTAARIKASLELGRRLYVQGYLDRPKIDSSDAAAALLVPLLAHQEQEHFYVLALDLNLRLLGEFIELYQGTSSTCYMRPAEVLREPIRRNAGSVIVGHNHPAGSLEGSPQDRDATDKLIQAGQALGISVLDHLLIARGGLWTSLKEKPPLSRCSRQTPRPGERGVPQGDPKRNPRCIAVLVMVDVSPLWICGCSVLHPAAATDEEALGLARVADRIGLLAQHVDDLGLLILAVESRTVDRLDVSDLAGKHVALCGLYGGYCVKEVASWLKGRGLRVTRVRDAIVWPPGIRPGGVLAAALFPGLSFDA